MEVINHDLSLAQDLIDQQANRALVATGQHAVLIVILAAG